MSKNKRKNSIPKDGVRRTENSQKQFLMAGVDVFLKNGELSEMSIQNDYGAIAVRRTQNGNMETYAIGFVDDEERQDDLEFSQHGNFADSDDEERRDDDYNEFIKKNIRWF